MIEDRLHKWPWEYLFYYGPQDPPLRHLRVGNQLQLDKYVESTIG